MQIADRYTVTATLGKGAMGIVYKATDSLLDKVVALKVLSNFSETHFQRFQREAKVAAQLSHPNIVKVLDLGIVDNSPYMVMEYIEGRTLDALIKKGPVPIPVAIPILIQICLAMGHAHEKGVLHRDLKPSNIMLAKTEAGEAAMLMDFGIAKIMSDEQSLTASGLALGTPPYMAPEQIRAEAIDGRADIYAFGVLMFELLTGRLPFRGQNSIETMNLKLTETAPSLGQTTGTDFDATLEQIVSTCLERNKQARFVSFAELASLLENFELHVSSVAIQSVERAKKKQQGSLLLALILSAISAIVIPVAIFSNSKQHDKNVRPVGRDPLDRADHLSDGQAKALERVNFDIVPSKTFVPGYMKIVNPENKDLENFVKNYQWVNNLEIENFRGDGDGLKCLTALDLKELCIKTSHLHHQPITLSGLNLGSFKHLTILRLISISTDDKILRQIADEAPSLVTLEIGSGLSCTKDGLSALQRLTHLENLYLVGDDLTDDLLSGLKPVKKGLIKIYLHRNPDISARGIEMLARLKPKAVQIDGLTPEKVDRAAFYKALGSLPTVSHISFVNADMSHIKELADSKCLVYLSVAHSDVNAKNILSLKSLPSLQSLEFNQCIFENDTVVFREIGRLPLKDLRLVEGAGLSLNGILQLSGNKSLKNLGIEFEDLNIKHARAEIERGLPQCSVNL